VPGRLLRSGNDCRRQHGSPAPADGRRLDRGGTEVPMKDRWLKFWAAAGASGDPEPEWRALSARYAEPHRAYHTIDHIAHCLEELDEVRGLAADPVAVEMALWYHDAVYDPRAKDNESRSADLARRAGAALGLAPERGERVARLIL